MPRSNRSRFNLTRADTMSEDEKKELYYENFEDLAALRNKVYSKLGIWPKNTFTPPQTHQSLQKKKELELQQKKGAEEEHKGRLERLRCLYTPQFKGAQPKQQEIQQQQLQHQQQELKCKKREDQRVPEVEKQQQQQQQQQQLQQDLQEETGPIERRDCLNKDPNQPSLQLSSYFYEAMSVELPLPDNLNFDSDPDMDISEIELYYENFENLAALRNKVYSKLTHQSLQKKKELELQQKKEAEEEHKGRLERLRCLYTPQFKGAEPKQQEIQQQQLQHQQQELKCKKREDQRVPEVEMQQQQQQQQQQLQQDLQKEKGPIERRDCLNKDPNQPSIQLSSYFYEAMSVERKYTFL
ncbi:hypothetical protein PoB_006601000 [Plakobranchus ocellatus]|uniref:Uncharacterized protein n=1 Tax=Plakobranchus ocellatus TaxID=259542 RepID=A0AAV4D5T0_9GAST|nr:hypothetical protein PoB_006601000 [Plakobranchus ocellatus]